MLTKSQFNEIDNFIFALSVFIEEAREEMAAIRAYILVFDDRECSNSYIKRANESNWRELLSELARLFDRSKTGPNNNCTLVRLKEMCEDGGELQIPLQGDADTLLQALDAAISLF